MFLERKDILQECLYLHDSVVVRTKRSKIMTGRINYDPRLCRFIFQENGKQHKYKICPKLLLVKIGGSWIQGCVPHEAEAVKLLQDLKPMPKKKPSKKSKYLLYLKSKDWKEKRAKKFEDVGKVCEECGSERKIQVHHLKYRKLYNVTNKDLQVLCERCHTKAHNK